MFAITQRVCTQDTWVALDSSQMPVEFQGCRVQLFLLSTIATTVLLGRRRAERDTGKGAQTLNRVILQ